MPTSKWKLLGIAGAVGVAATGVAVARKRRDVREDLPPDELRAKLHARLAEAQAPAAGPTPPVSRPT